VGTTELNDNTDTPAVGQIVTVDPSSTSYFAYSAWTIDGSNVLDGPAHATAGGVVTIKEGVDDGTATFKLKVPDSGLTGDGDYTCTVSALGILPIACLPASGSDAELISGTIATTNAVVAPDANDDLVEYSSLVWNVTAATCTGDGNAGALTVNGSNEIVCSADDGGVGGGDPVLVDTTAITDGSGVDLTSGVGVDITLATGPSPDTATFAVDNTELNDFTWGDGTDATMVHTFDPSGATSNPTIQAKDAELEFTIDGTNGVELVDVTGTPTLKILGTGSIRASSVVCDDCVNVSDLGDGADTALVGEYVRVNSGDATILEYRTNAETLSDIGAASTSHATTHSDAGSDEVTAENLATACSDAEFLSGDGLGGLECEAPAGGFTNFDITDTDATPILTVDSGEQIQYIGAGTVTVVAAADASNHDVTITGSAHTTASGITMGGDVSGTADAAQVDDVQSATTNLEAADNNTTQVASTSFVQQEINGAGGTDLTCSAGQCNVDNPVTAATTASNLAADGVDALTEIAQGIKSV
jgi:hypothetical protein